MQWVYHGTKSNISTLDEDVGQSRSFDGDTYEMSSSSTTDTIDSPLWEDGGGCSRLLER